VSCVWLCPTHIVVCFLFCLSWSCVLCMVVSNTYCGVFFVLFFFVLCLVYGKQNKKHTTICVGHHHTQDTRRRKTKQKTHHNMCWTQPYTRHKTKTNKTKNTTQYVLDTTILPIPRDVHTDMDKT
jgi:amino acid permease